MTTNANLDSHATALLCEQGYFTTPQYEQKAMISHSVVRRYLQEWREAGLLGYHAGPGTPPHYTLPGHPPMLGREARWRLVAQPLLEQKGFVKPSEYHDLIWERFSLGYQGTVGRDLAAWVQAGRLQGAGPPRMGIIYLHADVDPRTWEPRGPVDGSISRMHRWVIARRIIEEDGRLTLPPLAKQSGVSFPTVQHDVAIWTDQGWLERHGTGTYIYWRLPSQGPLNDHAPDRSERVKRILAELRAKGALTAQDAAELNHCSMPVARRDLNAAILTGRAVRVRFGGIVWLSFPLPQTLERTNWGEAILELAQQGEYEGQEELLHKWQWNALTKTLPVTAREAAQTWSINTATARQRLAVLAAAGIVARESGGRHKPDRFTKVN